MKKPIDVLVNATKKDVEQASIDWKIVKYDLDDVLEHVEDIYKVISVTLLLT